MHQRQRGRCHGAVHPKPRRRAGQHRCREGRQRQGAPFRARHQRQRRRGEWQEEEETGWIEVVAQISIFGRG